MKDRKITLVVGMAVVAAALGLVASGSCAGPRLAVGSAIDDANPPSTGGVVHRGQAVTVTGTLFHSGCEDTSATGAGCSGSPAAPTDPEAPLRNVQLTLHQRSRTSVLGTADATGKHYSISWSWRLPSSVQRGPAQLRAATAVLPVTIGS